VGVIVQRSILVPLAAGEHQLAHIRTGGGWLPILPHADDELMPLYSAIRQLGPALEHQVDEWLETDRRSQAALIFLQLNRRLHEPIREATEAASFLQKVASLPPSLSESVRVVQEQLERIAAVLDSEQESALSSLGRHDVVSGALRNSEQPESRS
ncbi:MAG: hypothetical protein ABI718_17735, partial [Acidobacteriota bacterium]